MPTDPAMVMTFGSLDEAESALDWIGVEFFESGEGAFGGVLTADAGELLDDALDDAETPGPVRDLAVALRRLLDSHAGDGEAAWRVGYRA